MISYQAKQVWRKFGAWYGADVIERKFGTEIPDDWAEVIDAIDRDKLDRTLADTRAKHPTWPPGLPEFEQIAKSVAKPVWVGPPMQVLLMEFVVRTKSLTRNQLASPWSYLYAGDILTGVVVPSDGDAPGYRVMVIDMQAEAA